jgi:hypothetical protein
MGERWAAAPVKEKEKGNMSLVGTYMEGIVFSGAVSAASLANNTIQY